MPRSARIQSLARAFVAGTYLGSDGICRECGNPYNTGTACKTLAPMCSDNLNHYRKCFECQPLYWLDSDGQCHPCSNPNNTPDRCAVLSATQCSDGQNHYVECEACQPLFWPDQYGQCMPCTTPNNANCKDAAALLTTCTDDMNHSQQCSECKPGYYLAGNKQCYRCSQSYAGNCLDSAGTCYNDMNHEEQCKADMCKPNAVMNYQSLCKLCYSQPNCALSAWECLGDGSRYLKCATSNPSFYVEKATGVVRKCTAQDSCSANDESKACVTPAADKLYCAATNNAAKYVTQGVVNTCKPQPFCADGASEATCVAAEVWLGVQRCTSCQPGYKLNAGTGVCGCPPTAAGEPQWLDDWPPGNPEVCRPCTNPYNTPAAADPADLLLECTPMNHYRKARACRPTYWLDGSDGQCHSCSNPNNVDAACAELTTQCTAMNHYRVCALGKCRALYYMDQYQQCMRCDASYSTEAMGCAKPSTTECVGYNKAIACDECLPGFYRDSGLCSPCAITYNDRCADGYLMPSCVEYSRDVNRPRQCSKCNAGWQLDSNSLCTIMQST
ncbi:hypothetical protein HYH02_008205 [Chlamydomonas schloesseri]|uniref:Uncharacterized protein n=1 Tax=Chlamydomonas schloesseri TaxID=2026947 RepID=A0A836B3I7_9CHLO|nr:hypothetical protein HYH02_008205 [Chlamydomonas schloesseri]|eukprot:KAG2446631.1 hypothetical protein HYH02_008205 [Chlamydomonas schloesseri]